MTDYIALSGVLAQKLAEAYPGDPIQILALYADHLIYTDGSATYRVDFAGEGDLLTLSGREEVETAYVPKGTNLAAESMAVASDGKLIDDGWTWPIEILKEGPTRSANASLAYWGIKNKQGIRYYTAAALKRAAETGVFENRPLVYQPESDHTQWGQGRGEAKLRPNEESENTFGMTTDVTAVERDGKTYLRGFARLSRNKVGTAFRQMLMQAAESGRSNTLLDLSWTGPYEGVLLDPQAGTPIVQVNSITEAVSIIPCEIGNAGGRVLRAAESHQYKTMTNSIRTLIGKLGAKNPKALGKDYSKILRAAEADGAAEEQSLIQYLAQSCMADNPTLGQVYDSPEEFAQSPKFDGIIMAWLKEELETGENAEDPGDQAAAEELPAEAKSEDEPKAAESLNARRILDLNKRLALAHLEVALGSSTELPNPVKDNFRETITKRVQSAKAAESVLTERDIDTELANIKNMAAQLQPAPRTAASITVGEDNLRTAVFASMFFNAKPEVARAAESLIGFNPLDRKYAPQRINSFRKLLALTHDGHDVFDALSGGNPRAAESYTTGAGSVNEGLILDALHMRGLAAWYSPKWDEYKLIATADTAMDFRANHSLNIGMPSATATVVDYTSDFTELSIAGKEDTSISVVGHGNIFSIRFDQIKNDMIGQIAQAPEKIFYAYKKGLYNNTFNKYLNGNSTNFAGDSATLISTARGNRLAGDPSLSGASVIAARNAMLAIPELGSNDASGLVPNLLIYGPNLHEQAYKILTPTAGMANTTATADQDLGLKGLEVVNWTGNQWFLHSDEVDTLKIYYLDGKQEPELAQENPLAAVSFTQMALRYRVHFAYGLDFVNPRGVVGSFAS